jgi:CO/xanthine dehydrogenase Mo-binding subunit
MLAVGSSLPRLDAAEKVSGTALYAGDIDLPGQAWLKTVFAGVPHARVNAVNVSRAEAAPGVIAVLTAKDVPVNEFGLIMPDQPVICGLGSSEQAAVVRWEADRIALVVAESARQAAAAAKLIEVDYTPLPVITDPLEAMQSDAHVFHPNPFDFMYGERDLNSNVLHSFRIHTGDVDAAFTAADVVIEATYRTHAQEHLYLQPEAGLAHVLADGRVEVICAGQWMHEEREQIAHALGLPEEQVIVRFPAIGGAFGGREDISIQICLALAALKTGRPIKVVWSREESIRGHHKRHPYIIRAKWGATRDGKIIAAQNEVISDAGAYASTSTKVLGNAVLACLGPYNIPNVAVEAKTVYTSNCPNGAFRGFGGPQGHFAAEMQVNKLAAALEMDPIELRRRNVLRDGDLLATRSPVPAGCTAAEVLEAAAGQFTSSDETRHPSRNADHSLRSSLDASRTHVARGRGLAICLKNVGFSLGFPEACNAWVELQGASEIERAIVGCVGAEVGQGAHSLFRQVAAQVLGVDPVLVELRSEDTESAGSSGSASASRMSFMAGNAIKGAAERALVEWQNEERPARATYTFHPRSTSIYDAETGEADPNITYGYCAQVADVEVDLGTGHITVKRLVSVNDVGLAVNPQQVEGQIEGAAAQSLGWTLMEEVVQQDGKILNPAMSSYLIPGVLDVAEEIVSIILEYPDPQGPLGARGMAEMPFIPTAPAIAAALHDATGIWMDELPYTPERVWRALR